MDAGQIHHIYYGELIECPYCKKEICLKSFELDEDMFEVSKNEDNKD